MTHTPMAAISHTLKLATRTPGQLRPPNLDSRNSKMSSTGTRGPGGPRPRPFPTAGPLKKIVPSQHFLAKTVQGCSGNSKRRVPTKHGGQDTRDTTFQSWSQAVQQLNPPSVHWPHTKVQRGVANQGQQE